MSEGKAFKYRVALGVSGTLTLDDDTLYYRQGLAKQTHPLATIRLFAVRDRGSDFLGLAQSELLIRSEPEPGRVRVQRIPFRPRDPVCQEALGALRAAIPQADGTALEWEEAARRIGVKAYPWYEGFMNTLSLLGVALTAGAGMGAVLFRAVRRAEPTSRAEMIGESLAFLTASIAGIALIVIGWRRSRPKR